MYGMVFGGGRAWKKPDEEKLVKRVQWALVALFKVLPPYDALKPPLTPKHSQCYIFL